MTFKHEPDHIRVSTAIADELCGDYDLSALNHTDRVTLLNSLYLTLEHTKILGWHEHTGDWDWRIELTLDDGEIIPAPIPEGLEGDDWERAFDGSHFSDTFRLCIPDEVATPDERRAFDAAFTACVDAPKLTEIEIELYPAAGTDTSEPIWRRLNIDNIRSINIIWE